MDMISTGKDSGLAAPGLVPFYFHYLENMLNHPRLLIFRASLVVLKTTDAV